MATPAKAQNSAPPPVRARLAAPTPEVLCRIQCSPAGGTLMHKGPASLLINI